MDKIKQFSHNLWLWKCLMPENPIKYEKNLKLESLFQSEWSKEFEKLCKNRMVMGALRYGKINEPKKPTYKRVESIMRRLFAYEKTGNTEHLVDIANLAMLEFVEGTHPLKHFNAIDDGEHTEVKK